MILTTSYIFIETIFTDVVVNGERTKFRKQRLCWLAQKDHVKISNDVSRRYIPDFLPVLIEIPVDSSQIMWRSDTIARGESIVVKFEQELYIGTVLNFHIAGEKTKKAKTYLKDFVSLKLNTNVSLLLDPLNIIQSNMELVSRSDTHKYFHKKHYLCHVSSHKVDLKNPVIKHMLNTFINQPPT